MSEDTSFDDLMFLSWLNKKLEKENAKKEGNDIKEEQSDITHPLDLVSQSGFSFVDTNVDKNETNPIYNSIMEFADRVNPFKIFNKSS